MNTSSIISRVWSFRTTLRDDGVGYGYSKNHQSMLSIDNGTGIYNWPE